MGRCHFPTLVHVLSSGFVPSFTEFFFVPRRGVRNKIGRLLDRRPSRTGVLPSFFFSFYRVDRAVRPSRWSVQVSMQVAIIGNAGGLT